MTKILNKYEKNLIKLATFLRNNVKQESFDMLNYRSYRNHKNIITRKNYEDIFSCGTIACALGHGPRIKGLLPGPEDFIGETFNWNRYAKNKFALDVSKQDEGIWCFSSAWTPKDNTPEGAAKRIEILVYKGLPEDWKEQICEPNYPLYVDKKEKNEKREAA